MSATPELEEIEDALTNVIDPELGLDFVELGLIYGVEIDGGHVHVTFTLTTPACPIGPQVSEQIDEFVSEIDGVDEVTSAMVFTPPWTPEKMSEDAKFAPGYWGPRGGAVPRRGRSSWRSRGGSPPRPPLTRTPRRPVACSSPCGPPRTSAPASAPPRWRVPPTPAWPASAFARCGS